MIMVNSLLYPASRGYIHITSPTDIYATPDFDTGYLSDPADVAPLIWAYKKTSAIVRRMPAYVEEIAGPELVLTSEDVSPNRDLPGEVKEIVYTPEDDAIIEKFVRGRITSTFHPWCIL
jgi:alcohol oxidase